MGMSELRVRDRSARVVGIARHGRLPKPSPWAAIFKFLAAALAVVLVSGVSVAAVAFNSIYAKRDIVTLVNETEGPPPQIGAIEGGFNILIVGTDTRVGQGGIGGTEDEVDSELNDVNILLHVSQDQTNATAISFPRDLVVPIPECAWEDGSGTKGYSTESLNTALFYGGLPCVVMTIAELTGLPIQFAGMIPFQGVISMTNAIGGVDVCTTGPIEEAWIEGPGVHSLQGDQALAFLRARKPIGDGSDLSRISSQQVYLSSMVRTIKSSETITDPAKLFNLANAAIGSMQLSSSLADPSTMVSIALALKDIPLERVTFVTYPGHMGGTGVYAGKVQPNEYLAEELMEQIRSDQPYVLAETEDRGSIADPNAPVPDPNASPDPSATPIDNTDLPVINVPGQTAADYTCSVTRDDY
jgi:LCP family protein required for cell wall assembly